MKMGYVRHGTGPPNSLYSPLQRRAFVPNLPNQDGWVNAPGALPLRFRSASIAPDMAELALTSIAPSVVLGSLAITPANSPLTLDALAPQVVLGSVSITPANAPLALNAIAPTVMLGSLSITPAQAGITLTGVAPTVILGAISVSPDEAILILDAQPPTVVIEGIIGDPGDVTVSVALVATVRSEAAAIADVTVAVDGAATLVTTVGIP